MSLQQFNAIKKQLTSYGITIPKGTKLVILEQALQSTELLLAYDLEVSGSTVLQIIEVANELLTLEDKEQSVTQVTKVIACPVEQRSEKLNLVIPYHGDEKAVRFKPFERLGISIDTDQGITKSSVTNRTFSGSADSKSTAAPYADPAAYAYFDDLNKRQPISKDFKGTVEQIKTQGHYSTGYCPSGRKKDVDDQGNPVTRSICKKTKAKISWGTKNPETGSTKSLPGKYLPKNVQYQSRWYKDPVTKRKYTIRIEKNLVTQIFDRGELGLMMKAIWNSDLSGDYSLVPSNYQQNYRDKSIFEFEKNVYALFPTLEKTSETKQERAIMLSPMGLPADQASIDRANRIAQKRENRRKGRKQARAIKSGKLDLTAYSL